MIRYGWAATILAIVVRAGAAYAQTAPLVPVPAPAADAVTAMTAKPCQPAPSPAEDWPALCRYQGGNRLVYRAPPAVLMGDSITDFWLQVSPGLFAGGIVDRGISGQTCGQMVARFYQDVVRLRPRCCARSRSHPFSAMIWDAGRYPVRQENEPAGRIVPSTTAILLARAMSTMARIELANSSGLVGPMLPATSLVPHMICTTRGRSRTTSW